MKEQVLGVPAENFSQGLFEVEIPELGPKLAGKVRDMWVVGDKRVIVTTDRQSAFDSIICTIPGKGAVLNSLSAWWFEETRHIAPNHLITVPHPNVMITKQAEKVIGVEVVLRRYMARSSTKTSVYYNYSQLGRRNIYGIVFPEGLKANCEFPMGTILTPTTKSVSGHDEELTEDQAAEIANRDGGPGTWGKIKVFGRKLFEAAHDYHLNRGLILVDTKFEFGLGNNGNLMIIDEIFTPDSSRFWLAANYHQRFATGENPESFDKDILRRWLAAAGFTGDGPVPKVPPEVVDQMSTAYKRHFEMVTEESLPETEVLPEKIKQAVLQSLSS